MEKVTSRKVITIILALVMALSIFALPINAQTVEASNDMTIDVSKLDKVDIGTEDGSTYYYDAEMRSLELYKSGYTLTGTNNDLSIFVDETKAKLTISDAKINNSGDHFSCTITAPFYDTDLTVTNSTLSGKGFSVIDVEDGKLQINNSTIDGNACAFAITINEPTAKDSSIEVNGECKFLSGNMAIGLSNDEDYSINNRTSLNMGLNSKLTLVNKSFTLKNGKVTDDAHSDFNVNKTNGYFLTDADNPLSNPVANTFPLTLKENKTQTIQVVPNTTKIHTPKKNIYLKKKTSVTLPVKAYSSDVANPKLTWASNKPSIACNKN